MRTYVEVSKRTVLAERVAGRRDSERLFWERAGFAAIPESPAAWHYDELRDSYYAWCDIPETPEGLLL